MKRRPFHLLLMGVGLLSVFFGFLAHSTKIWPALLLAGFYGVSLGLGGMVFLAIQDVTGSRWSVHLRPAALRLMRIYGPSAVLFFVALAVGGAHLFHTNGAAETGTEFAAQAWWLSYPFLPLRAAFYLGLWGLFARRFQRRGPAAGPRERMSVLFLICLAVTLSLASFEWLMTSEPHWSSTIFGVYIFSGLFLSALAGMAIIRWTRPIGPDSVEDLEERHDLGKLIFGFSLFWAYIWYCQYLLIWYSNLPEEVVFYARRHHGVWAAFTIATIAFNWFLPFVGLLPRWTKENRTMLLALSLVILIGHWLDLYVILMPCFAEPAAPFSLWEAGIGAATLAAAAWLALPEGEPA